MAQSSGTTGSINRSCIQVSLLVVPPSPTPPKKRNLGHCHHQCKVQLCWFTTHQRTYPSWAAQGRRALPFECAHHPPHWVWATAVTDVKCNCAGSPHISWHTHHGKHKDAVHSPASEHTIPLASQSEPLPSMKLSATVLVYHTSTDTHHGQRKDAVHSPASEHTIPLASQSEPPLIKVHLCWFTTPQLTPPSWSAQGRRALPYECAHHPPRFPIRATAINEVECNCAGSPHINWHPSWSAQGRHALSSECAHHPLASQSVASPSLM